VRISNICFRQTLIGGEKLLAFLRHLWCFIAVVSFGQGVGLLPAWAAPIPTITTLSVTSDGNVLTTIAPGSVVTLTATVMAGSTPVTPGQVNFCDATAKFCTDIHLLGTAQLTANGTATLKFRPGVGNHSYKAVLAGPASLGPSASTASSLIVTALQDTGQLATTTYLEASGVPNIYSLTARVPGDGNTLPTGVVSFVDASNGNAVLGTAALTSEPGAGFAGSSLLPVASLNSRNAVLTADFNGDGIPDLVILGNDTISVLLGNGDGTFTAAPYPSSELPGAIAVGDFNGDGIPDLAVAPVLDEGDSEVLLGKGDGTFTIAKGSFGIANGTSTSNSIAVGDFNGDGNLDLVETCASVDDQPCNLLLTQFGNGDGTFMQSSGIPLAFSGSQSVAVGDFNGDGKPDLAVTNSGANGVNVFLNSDGVFSAMAARPATGDSPTSVAAADFNGDGKLDLAVANSGSNNVTILLGNGDGTFTAAATLATGIAPNSLAVGDFNGDGVPDVAVANAGSSNVTILLGNGDGTFTAAASPAADTGSTSVVSADFNGDGKEDLVVANSQDNSATALLGATTLAIATVNNISPVGVGTHLVKAIYSGDVNYGGSTSSNVSLTVVSPGFTLSGTSVSVVAGATGTSTLTITPKDGFSGTVALDCGGGSYPGSASDVPICSAIPQATISGSAPATVTFSIQTQPGTTPGQYLLGVNAVDSSGVAMADTAVAVTVIAPAQSFTLTNTPVSIATPGASGTSTITITPSDGFSAPVALSCTVTGPATAVDLPTCSVAAPPAITSIAAVSATLTVNTTAASSSSNATDQAATAFRKQRNRLWAFGGGNALAAFLFFGLPLRRLRTKTLLSLLLLGAFAAIVMGCGGSQKAANPVTTPTNPVMTPANPGTTAGSYLVTVTGSSRALTASTTVAVTVN
jgi:trimeric autotransporter adhesin